MFYMQKDVIVIFFKNNHIYELNFFWVGNLKHRKRKHKITSFVLGKNTPRASAINLGVRGDGHE